MPSKSSSSKRKQLSESDEEPKTKPVKKAKSSSQAMLSGQPTNTVLPEQIEFGARPPGTLRIATWNVCGLAAAQKKGFERYVEAEDADILILTETKVNSEPVDAALGDRYPYQYWSISDKKTYSGTAVLSKEKPLSVTMTLPGHPDESAVKGRIITAEFEKWYVVGTYVVNAGTGLKTLDAKREWNEHFEAYIRALDEKKGVIWAGDLNVAPGELDLAHAKRNWNKTAGYTEAETSSFGRILGGTGASAGFVDVWRRLHGSGREYTYFSYRFGCRGKGLGWRLDMYVLSGRLLSSVRACEIRGEIYGPSDHCPVVLDLARE